MSEQMVDLDDVPCDVHHVRTFRNGRELGAGYDLRAPATWFVYNRESASAKWQRHCGPYSAFEQAADWIKGIRESRFVACANCGGTGSLQDMSCCPICGGGGVGVLPRENK